MRVSIINHLVCPVCCSAFDLLNYKKIKERVLETKLECRQCGKKFYIRNGISYFIPPPGRQGLDKEVGRKITLTQEIPEKWIEFFSREELLALKKEWQWMLSSVKKNKNALHLDFASGTGRFLRNIIPSTKGEIVSLDFGYSTCEELVFLLKKIKKYKRISVVCAEAQNMPFKDNTFDSVSTWHGLDEMKMEKAIREAYRVLKREGCFTASGIHYQEGSKSFLRAKKHRISFLTKEMIMQTLKVAGFCKIEYKVFYKGYWNEKGDYLPMFNDLYITYVVRGKK